MRHEARVSANVPTIFALVWLWLVIAVGMELGTVLESSFGVAARPAQTGGDLFGINGGIHGFTS